MTLPLLTLETLPPRVEIGKGLHRSPYLAKIDSLAKLSRLADLWETRLGDEF